MLQGWRWYGPNDPVSLDDIQQAGASCVVTALHQLPNGVVWSREEIAKRQREISFDSSRQRARPLFWGVVESVPVTDAIKTRTGPWREHIANYCETLRNLAECGVRVVCYNFMPMLDWTRTDLGYEMPDGSRALRFDWVDMALFDVHLLRRDHASNDYAPEVLALAQQRADRLTPEEATRLEKTIIAGLPGSEESFTLESFRNELARYKNMDAARLRENLAGFIREVAPVAQEVGLRLAIHPDDPPFPILGLPRVVSTAEDVAFLFRSADVSANGLTLCVGSLGARKDNDLPAMMRQFAPRVHFLHLRNVTREDDHTFHEADHLGGSSDMFAVMQTVVQEEHRRRAEGREDDQIPMRPDHGHQMLDDLKKAKVNPGYTAIGRLRGLAELRGLEMGIRRSMFPE